MNTSAHVIVNLWIAGRPDRADRIVPVTAGALLPDVPIIAFYGYHKFLGLAEDTIWGEAYQQRLWQDTIDAFNSIPRNHVHSGVAQLRADAVLLASKLPHLIMGNDAYPPDEVSTQFEGLILAPQHDADLLKYILGVARVAQ